MQIIVLKGLMKYRLLKPCIMVPISIMLTSISTSFLATCI
jgi:hypothetical protein